ncbi:MarR family winged helix-turn-helix transcriptional regulator [Candidatus Thiothrix sp. Deng01]|uniref:MarR family winged helix-turn-helix transcriptional regulator n=1 Tax=Candidatus Thiothrix phosphatis TaxID=3112415 RepID=A0ABU6CSR9_9GAMM|nr:MarR family winged helix-turn-helix transcriptional regulator [Candidatus Thiothrix sp. Deng01]MEB4589854.1 MarR family winged helix-turn-helix transcriptional regulator [Candidatus Thiothrix sp. Deng01]
MSNTTLTTASPLETHIGFWLRFVSNQVSSRFQKLLEEHGTTVTEWVAMRTLYAREDVTHAELINALGMTKGAASKILSKLEGKALIERRFAENSAKVQVLRLTEKGNALLPVLAALADANDAFFFGHLDETQQQALLTLMQELVNYHQLQQLPLN